MVSHLGGQGLSLRSGVLSASLISDIHNSLLVESTYECFYMQESIHYKWRYKYNMVSSPEIGRLVLQDLQVLS